MKAVLKKNNLLNILLFAGIGCFSYLFLVLYADIPKENLDALTSYFTITEVIAGFTVLGICFLYINNRIYAAYPNFMQNRTKIGLYFIFIALLLFGLNYLLVVLIKWIVGLPHPFNTQWLGIKMLLTIWLIELIVVCQIMVNNFYRHLISLNKRNSELEESSIKAQYQALQNQLNPHFLFNSLNTLISEIEYNPKNATLFTRHLSDVYRYILQCEDQQLVTLRSELDFLDSYVYLHQVRLGNCIQLNNDVNPDYFEMKVPPLTLQLLAENVIKHNVINQGNPMTIDLTFEPKNSFLVMKNKINEKKNVISSGKGLKNLSFRYRLICNQDIIIENNKYCFTVKVLLFDE